MFVTSDKSNYDRSEVVAPTVRSSLRFRGATCESTRRNGLKSIMTAMSRIMMENECLRVLLQM